MSTTSSTAEEKVNSVYASRQSLKDNKVHEDLHSDVHIQDDGFAISVLSGPQKASQISRLGEHTMFLALSVE